MSMRRSQRSAAVKAKEAITDNAAYDRPPSRSARKAAENISSATVSRGATTGSPRGSQSLSLTVKTSSSKLREAIRSSPLSQSQPVSVGRDRFAGGEILEGKRSRNVRKSYVLESDSDDDEDEEMEDVGDEDAEGEDDDDDMDAEDDGLGDEDAEGDIDMEVPPPPPTIKISKAQGGRQTITAKAPKGDNKTVEQKETEGSDDEELSELDSDVGEEVEEEEAMQTGNEEDAEGEEEEIEVEEEVEEDDDELDSDDDTPGGGSRASTPDLNKLTKRQRARLEEGGSGYLMALPDGTSLSYSRSHDTNNISEVQVKKHLTAEEHAMRRAEMARRRKNLSEKRNEEEKVRI